MVSQVVPPRKQIHAAIRFDGDGAVAIETIRAVSVRGKIRRIVGRDSMHIDHDNLSLGNESDVEQKIVMPLLTGSVYLEIPQDRIFISQSSISRLRFSTSSGEDLRLLPRLFSLDVRFSSFNR